MRNHVHLFHPHCYSPTCLITSSLLSDACIFQEFIKAIELALFRPLLDEKHCPILGNMDEDVIQYSDPEWPHLSIVYEILLHIVGSIK